MRSYGKVETGFWPWARRKRLSEGAVTLALYLLSGPHANAIGVYSLPLGYVATDLGVDPETVSERFAELSRHRFAYRCETTEYVFIRDFLDHNAPENGNVGKAMAKLVATIPGEFGYWPEFIDALKPYGKRFPEGFVERLASGMATQEPEPEPEPDRVTPLRSVTHGGSVPAPPCADPATHADRDRDDGGPTVEAGQEPPEPRRTRWAAARPKIYPADFEAAWAGYPGREGSNDKRLAHEAWNARLKEGHTAEAMAAGTARYADWCRATGITGTRVVKQAASFFGPADPPHFTLDWVPGPAPPSSGPSRAPARDVTGAVAELRERYRAAEAGR